MSFLALNATFYFLFFVGHPILYHFCSLWGFGLALYQVINRGNPDHTTLQHVFHFVKVYGKKCSVGPHCL